MRLLIPGAMMVQRERRHRATKLGQYGGVLALQCPREAQADPLLGHRAVASGLGGGQRSLAGLRILRGDRSAPLRTIANLSGAKLVHRSLQCQDAVGDVAGDREIGSEVAHRRACRERVLSYLDNGATILWPMDLRRPRGERIEHEDRAGTLDELCGICLGGHRMIGRDRKRQRPVLADRNAPFVARAESVSNASALPVPCWAKITGCSALARMLAASAICFGFG